MSLHPYTLIRRPYTWSIRPYTYRYMAAYLGHGGSGKKILAWEKLSRGVGVPGLAREKKTVAVFSEQMEFFFARCRRTNFVRQISDCGRIKVCHIAHNE